MQVPSPPAVTGKPIYALDVECYRNFFLVKLRDRFTGSMWEFRQDYAHAFNWPALKLMLDYATIITFNGLGYDLLMVSAAATGRFNNDQLKQISDAVFANKWVKPWEIAEHFGVEMLSMDHIDLMPVAPGDGGLKQYGGRLHTKRMQDLPYPPEKILTPAEMDSVAEYCGNDLVVTIELYDALEDDIETRVELTDQYGVEMRSKSDAQIAEAAFKKILGLTYRQAKELNQQAQKPPLFSWKYTPVPFLQFQTAEMQAAYQRVLDTVFTLNDKSSIEALNLKGYQFGFDGAVYTMGIGGLHSNEARTCHRAGPDCVLTDFDVASYYPEIIRQLGLYPAHIGPVFLKIYGGWIDIRIEYKNGGKKKKAKTYKIKLNGTFGKTKERHSILFDPVMFIQITLTGQLALLMMIERQYLAGVHAVQANTDGVVLKCHPALVPMRDAVVKRWEADTGFTMEGTNYIALMSRDVNSYMAFKPAYTKDGKFYPIEVKTKGEYADDPSSKLAKNPANQICLDAMKEFLIYGTPIEQTIRRCDDIRKFVTVRNVAGGGSWVKETIAAIGDRVADRRQALIDAGWTTADKGKTWYEPCGDNQPRNTDEALRIVRAQVPREFIGKTVRWYYGVGQRGHICTPAGNMVAKTQGAKPCMELPDVLPPDIDYAWYVAEAESMLRDLGAIP